MIQYNFPRDYGSHNEFLIEWWYMTGWLSLPTSVIGFQITFFRFNRNQQFLTGHSAISNPYVGKIITDQIIHPESLGQAHVLQSTTDVKIKDWHLYRTDNNTYSATVPIQSMILNLTAHATQPPLLHSHSVMTDSMKPNYYYSEPQLRVTGNLQSEGTIQPFNGIAWLDHEWSNYVGDAGSIGWDWLCVNFDNADSLVCFRTRDSSGNDLNKHAVYRSSSQTEEFFNDKIKFSTIRTWISPTSNTKYPVEQTVQVGDNVLHLQPIFDDQEFDSQATAGVIYWEGAVRVLKEGQVVGRGYLEMTGYHKPFIIQ